MNTSSTSGIMKIRNGNKKQSEMSARPEKYPQGAFKRKPCRYCSKDFEPQAPSHLYCSQQCADDTNTSRYYERNYGVNLVFVKQLYEAQGGVCAICKTEGFKMLEQHSSGMNLDHCHETGVVRGLLCHNCNRGLGLLQDNPEYLRRAAEYVEKYK